MNRTSIALLCACAATAFAQNLDVQGTLLATTGGGWNDWGGKVFVVDAQTDARTDLVTKTTIDPLVGHPSNFKSPRFSPDGTRLVFACKWWKDDWSGQELAMFVADNDGSDITLICN
ncbi:MAG: hypothetical protein GF331_06625, partial [Chitinivibrionales bacterium]|nr:hypothetical protein [Chitinivibrionales bacterium]